MSVNTSNTRDRSHHTSASTSGGLKPLLLVQQHVAGPSHSKLFLTNLRLLDLDLRDDWPGIAAVTFSTKDAQQNQKKRIQCVEWALYRLFEIWDPDDTRYKLQPFFPPLEPLQSLNLRAALFRCLEQAKKAGALGRDTVLRKTMLDECKGERLDEVLSVFSTIVLKKVVEENLAPTAIAQQLSMENFSYTGERTTLSALIMAHKVSLSKALAAKKMSKADLDDFADLLNLKDRQITRRHEQLKVTMEEDGRKYSVSSREALDLQQRMQKNWTGDDEWLDTLLHGDSRFKKDGVLGNSFRKVWTHVETGSLGEIEDQNRQGLLEQLDARVREQNHRLNKWHDFQKSLTRNAKSNHLESKPELVKTKGLSLMFDSHHTLQVSEVSPKIERDIAWTPLEDYARLMGNVRDELAGVSTAQVRNSSPDRRPATSRRSLHSHIENPPEVPLHNIDQNTSSDSESNGPSPRLEKGYKKSTIQTPPSEPVEEPEEPAMDSLPIAIEIPVRDAVKEASKLANPAVLRPPLPPAQSDSPAASDILAAVLTTSPSPTKSRHVLSLAERTRLSMSRAPPKAYSASDSDDLPELTSLTKKLRRVAKQPPATDEYQSQVVSNTSNEDLVSRTRQSMSGLAEFEKKARLDRRRSIKAAERNKRESRTSYFPKHLETTIEYELDDGTDKMKLIDGEAEADYESVFKTRPKIKTSPVSSPVKAWGNMGAQELGSSSPGY